MSACSRPLAVLAMAAAVVPAALAAGDAAPPRRDLTELSLSELAALEVSTVGRTPEARGQTPAAVYVITRQDIQRAGATTLAEALRLAPGIQVARISASQWAVGMRGFASRLSRAVLVLIDGRRVYTPLFAGTYWEVQDVLLEDVERIEVIRGPGGTLWGANAVNGIINIITRHARDTHGGHVEAGAGAEERGFAAARWGGRLGASADGRVYAKYLYRDASFDPEGLAFDDWRVAQGGFRLDGTRGAHAWTVQGDLYRGRAGQRTTFAAYEPPFARTVVDDNELGGGNLRAHWKRALSGSSELEAQVYYDYTHRREPHFDEDRHTADVDAQYRRTLGRHQVLTGLGYRRSRGSTGGVPTVAFVPAARTDDIFSAFAQDRIALSSERLALTLGAKLERNDYSGFELQPSARVAWAVRPGQSLWAAVSRAVRTPSRLERDLVLTTSLDPGRPLFSRFLGNPDFRSERALVYEAGYRYQGEKVFVDVALFHNDYAHLLSVEPGAPFLEAGTPARTVVPVLIANGLQGEVSGGEVAADLRPAPSWNLHGSYGFVDMDLRPRRGSLDTATAASTEGSTPRHRVLLRSSVTLGTVQLDAMWRRVSALPAQGVAAYSSLNARAAWFPGAGLEVALVGRDLLRPRHREFGGGLEVERSVYGEVAWRF